MFKSKKAVSEMVSYVLLIVIAIGVSVAVFNFLSLYTPKQHAECSNDVQLILQDYSCISSSTGGQLNITLTNKGLFNVDAVYIRFGARDRKVKDLINEDNLYFGIFIGGNNPGLGPGDTSTKNSSISYLRTSGPYGLEIQPAIFTESNELALCPKATITQEITCS